MIADEAQDHTITNGAAGIAAASLMVFSGGLHVGAREPEAAKALIKFIKAPAAVPVIKKSGMEPG